VRQTKNAPRNLHLIALLLNYKCILQTFMLICMASIQRILSSTNFCKISTIFRYQIFGKVRQSPWTNRSVRYKLEI